MVHSTALNSSDNLHSYPPDNQHSSDGVYLREGGGVLGPTGLGLAFFLPRASLFISHLLVYFLLFVVSCQYLCKSLPHLRNDLLCVKPSET